MSSDLRIPSASATRIGLLVGVPIAVVLGVQAVSWAVSLKAWSPGETLTAAELNANFDAVNAALPAPIFCKKTVALPTGTTGYTMPPFAASDCTPAIVPTAAYRGALSDVVGCNGITNSRVVQPTATNGPTIIVYIQNSCAPPNNNYTLGALFVKL